MTVEQQVYDEGLPGLLLTEGVQSRGHEGETQGHHLQGLAAYLLVLPVGLLSRVGLFKKPVTGSVSLGHSSG